VTNVLDGLSARLTNVPAAYADEAAATFQEVAERLGGKMMGRYQLTIREQRRYVYAEGCTLILYGSPAGFWVWRESGAAAHAITAKPRRKAKTKGQRRGTGGARPGHAPTFTGRRAKRRKGTGRAKRMPGRLGGGLGHPQRGPVQHPGFAGKRAWSRTVAEVTPKLQAGLALVLAQAVD
jgi:hypothetical protein